MVKGQYLMSLMSKWDNYILVMGIKGTKAFLTEYGARMNGKSASIDAGCLMHTLFQYRAVFGELGTFLAVNLPALHIETEPGD